MRPEALDEDGGEKTERQSAEGDFPKIGPQGVLVDSSDAWGLQMRFARAEPKDVLRIK
jgi:hypothetical protein